jgi:hypothetical protein
MKNKSLTWMGYVFALLAFPTVALAGNCHDCYDDAKVCKNHGLLNHCEGTCGGAGRISERCYKDKKISKKEYESFRHYACGGCNSYPHNCSKIVTCVKYCRLSAHTAKSCYMNKYTSLKHCEKVYDKCKPSKTEQECHSKCNGYPEPVCKNLDFCYGGKCSSGASASSDAAGCYHNGLIDLDTCRNWTVNCHK